MQPLQIGCHHCIELSIDEENLAHILQALERKDWATAQTLTGKLIAGPLGRTFCRIANEYVGVLNRAGLSCVGIRKLRLV